MHELSLCESIARIATRAAAGKTISRIFLDVGHLRQVVPPTLVYCWGIVSETGPLAGSELVINHVPAILDCNVCGKRTEVTGFPLIRCEHCGSGSVTVISGEEFMLTSMDVQD